MFIVIRASLDYDYLPKDGLSYVCKFDSKELADAYISSVEENFGKWWKAANDRLDEFISQFELPSPLSMDKWKEICENLDPILDIRRPPSNTHNLRMHIKKSICDGRQLKNFDIQLGQRPECHFDLYIVEVKD